MPRQVTRPLRLSPWRLRKSRDSQPSRAGKYQHENHCANLHSFTSSDLSMSLSESYSLRTYCRPDSVKTNFYTVRFGMTKPAFRQTSWLDETDGRTKPALSMAVAGRYETSTSLAEDFAPSCRTA